MAGGQQVFTSQVSELNAPLEEESCILFDPERVTLDGVYSDELSAHRAKRGWIDALESYFLLDHRKDFSVSVRRAIEHSRFALTCNFTSACARYAFWRLTNQQAPEAQYLIETAHVPRGDSQHERFITAPDMRPTSQLAGNEPLVLGDISGGNSGPLSGLLDKILNQIRNRIKES